MKNAARVCVCLFLSALFANVVQAQTFTGTFLGTVTDPSGASVPAATITIINLATNHQTVVTTDSTGRYVAPALPPGNYRLSVTKTGFKADVRAEVGLQVDQQLEIDFKLLVGATSQLVVVSSTPPITDTQTATVGTFVSQQSIQELPLNGRNFLQLNLLVPGSLPGARGSQLGTQGGSINVHGLREASNFFMMDGIDNTTMAIGQFVVNPPIYSIQEFKVQSPNYSAEFGRTAGAQINVVTRSGGNNFHGDVYDFLRNSALDAKNFFDSPGKIPRFQRNEFGVDGGGPILKNRLFFFVGYEGIRQNQAQTFATSVPTPDEVKGNFSALLPNTVITDPATGQPFTDNTITSLDPIGAALAKYYPPPNNPGSQLNFISHPLSVHNDDSAIARIDYNGFKRDRILGRYNIQNVRDLDPVNPFAKTTDIPGFGLRQPATRFQDFGVSDTHTFSPTMIAQIKFGWNRWKLDYHQQDQGNPIASQLGIGGLSTDPENLGFPLLIMSGEFDNLGSATNLPQGGPFDTYDWAATFTKIRGPHTIEFGGDFHYYVSDFFLNPVARGEFVFTGQYSGTPLSDMLLGFPAEAVRGLGISSFQFVGKQQAYFAQDDWRVSPRVTLTAGLRYEYDAPIFEKQNRISNFYPTTNSVVLAGVDGASRATYNPDPDNFAPRLGLAYDLFGDGKWVTRVGYGVFYEIPVNNSQLGLRLNPPFFQAGIAFGDGSTVTLGNAFTTLASLPPSFGTFEQNFENGLVQEYNVDVQHQLLPSVVLDVGYVGTRGSSLLQTININQPLPGPGSVQPRRPFPQFANMNSAYSSANSWYNGLEVRLQKRFSQGLQFLGSYTYSKAIDTSSAEFGNSSDANSPQDSHNLLGERGLSDFDIRNRFVLSGVYLLPFGPGRSFLKNAQGFAAELIGGWQFQGIATIESGQPFTPVLASDNSNTGEFNDRPNVVGNPYAPGPGCPKTRTPECWVNPAAFALPARYTFGNAGRDILIGPPLREVDLGLIKDTPLGESRKLQFRAEMFNIANHPNFDNPSRTALTPLFGKVGSAEASRQIQFGLRFIY
jgi:outer membrane receptor protein involved in Fe transport